MKKIFYYNTGVRTNKELPPGDFSEGEALGILQGTYKIVFP
jgi:hypothetical protein